MIKYLLPKATVVTPNLFEAGQLSGLGKLTSIEDMKKAAQIIYDVGTPHVIIKGGKALIKINLMIYTTMAINSIS